MLERGYVPSSFEHDERKVILSEEVFARLQGLINATAFQKGIIDRYKINYGYEHGGFLYGNLDGDGNINFTVANDKADYQPMDGAFDMESGEEMFDEFMKNIQSSDFNCFADVHTHPYSAEANRLLSSQDVKCYKESFGLSEFLSATGKKINIFGCLLTQSSSNEPQKDDISFVYFNKENDKMYYLPNIFVKSRSSGKLYPLKKIREKLYQRIDGLLFNEQEVRQYYGTFEFEEIERTLLDTEEFEI